MSIYVPWEQLAKNWDHLHGKQWRLKEEWVRRADEEGSEAGVGGKEQPNLHATSSESSRLDQHPLGLICIVIK
jgi:hypothetical protein